MDRIFGTATNPYDTGGSGIVDYGFVVPPGNENILFQSQRCGSRNGRLSQLLERQRGGSGDGRLSRAEISRRVFGQAEPEVDRVARMSATAGLLEQQRAEPAGSLIERRSGQVVPVLFSNAADKQFDRMIDNYYLTYHHDALQTHVDDVCRAGRAFMNEWYFHCLTASQET